MTETEWLTSSDPEPMLEFLQGKAGDRRWRLFACACCRRVWHLLAEPRSRRGVEITELLVDGLVSREEFEAAALEARKVGEAAAWAMWTEEVPTKQGAGDWHGILPGGRKVLQLACLWANRAAMTAAATLTKATARASCTSPDVAYLVEQTWLSERAYQADLVRDLFGNPFQPVATIHDTWRTPTVNALAQDVYERRHFELLPILADALEDAGCCDASVLRHFRGSAVHARGCRLLDLVLGKE